MVICLYGLRARGDADRQAEDRLFEDLTARLRSDQANLASAPVVSART